VSRDLVEEAAGVAPRPLDERLQVGGQGLLGIARSGELVHVELVHPLKEVEVRVVRGPDADHNADSRDARSKPGRARERMRPAARGAHDGEAVDRQMVGERGDVAGGVDHTPARMRVGFAVPGAVVCDHAQAEPRQHAVLVRMPVEARSGRPMVADDGGRGGVAAVSVGEPATGRRLQVARTRLHR
jgi:hypothetical protein